MSSRRDKQHRSPPEAPARNNGGESSNPEESAQRLAQRALRWGMFASGATILTLVAQIISTWISASQTREAIELSRATLAVGLAPELEVKFSGPSGWKPLVEKAISDGRQTMDIDFSISISNAGDKNPKNLLASKISVHPYIQVGQQKFGAEMYDPSDFIGDGAGKGFSAPLGFNLGSKVTAKAVPVAALSAAMSGGAILFLRADIEFGTMVAKTDRFVQHACGMYADEKDLFLTPCGWGEGLEYRGPEK